MSLLIRDFSALPSPVRLEEEGQISPTPEAHLSLVLSNEPYAVSRVFTSQLGNEASASSEKVFVGYVSSSRIAYHEAQEDGLHLSHVLNGHLVVGIHNRGKKVRMLRFVRNSMEVGALRKLWDDFFARHPDGVVLQYFCGDGSYVVEEALALCDYRSRIVLVGIDPASTPAHPASYYYRSTASGAIQGGMRRYDVALDVIRERELPRLNRDIFTAALANPFLEFSCLEEDTRGLTVSPEIIQMASIHREIGFLDVSQFRFVVPNQEDTEHILMRRMERLQAVSQRISSQREFCLALLMVNVFEIALIVLKVSGYIGLLARTTQSSSPMPREILETCLSGLSDSVTMRTTLTCEPCCRASWAAMLYCRGLDSSGRLPDGHFPPEIYPEGIYPDGFFSNLQLGVLLQYVMYGEHRGHYPYGHFPNNSFPYERYFSGDLVACSLEPLPLDDEVGRILQGGFVPLLYPQSILVDGTHANGSRPLGLFPNPGNSACYEGMFPYRRFFQGDFVRERYHNFRLPDTDPLSAHFEGEELPVFYPGGIKPDGEFPYANFPYPYGVFPNHSFPYEEFFSGKFNYEERFSDNFRRNDPWNSPHATISVTVVDSWDAWNTSTTKFAVQVTEATSSLSPIVPFHTRLPSTRFGATIHEDQSAVYFFGAYWLAYGVCRVLLTGRRASKCRWLRVLALGVASLFHTMNTADLFSHCIATRCHRITIDQQEMRVDAALHTALSIYSSASMIYHTARFAAPWVRYQTFRLSRAISGFKPHKRIGEITRVDQRFRKEIRRWYVTMTALGLLAVAGVEHFFSVVYFNDLQSSEYRFQSIIQSILLCCIAVLLYGMMACNLI